MALACVTSSSPAIASVPPPPGGVPQDEIRLPSGGFVRGTISELEPGSFLVLIQGNQPPRRFEWSQIESVVLADGSVLTRDTVAMPAPAPGSDFEPEPEPEPEPDPDPEFRPEPEPTPTPEPTLSLTGPAPGSPLISIALAGDGPPVTLQRITDRAGTAVGSRIPRTIGAEPVCVSPCEQQIEGPRDEFFVAIGDKAIRNGFELPGRETAYQIDVKRPSPLMKWSGVALIPAAIIIGVGVGIIPAIHNVPQARVAGYAAGGALIALAGAGAGVTLILFSRGKIQVLPGAR